MASTVLAGADPSGEARDRGEAVPLCPALTRAGRGTCRPAAVQPTDEQATTQTPATSHPSLPSRENSKESITFNLAPARLVRRTAQRAAAWPRPRGYSPKGAGHREPGLHAVSLLPVAGAGLGLRSRPAWVILLIVPARMRGEPGGDDVLKGGTAIRARGSATQGGRRLRDRAYLGLGIHWAGLRAARGGGVRRVARLPVVPVRQCRVELEAFGLVVLCRPQDAPSYPEDVLQRVQKPWARRERSWSEVLLPAEGTRMPSGTRRSPRARV